MSHIPDTGQVLQRSYGWYASRVRGRRRTGLDADSERPLGCVEPLPEAVRGARRRWAEWLRRIVEVEPVAGPRCGQQLRIMAFITHPKVSDAILAHVERTAHTGSRSRAPPRRWRTIPASAPAEEHADLPARSPLGAPWGIA